MTWAFRFVVHLKDRIETKGDHSFSYPQLSKTNKICYEMNFLTLKCRKITMDNYLFIEVSLIAPL